MFLARRSFPVAPLGGFRRDFERLFNEFQRGLDDGAFGHEHGAPALNVWDDGEKFHAEAEVPGFRMKDIEVTVTGNQLTFAGRRETESEPEKNVTFHRRERRMTEFSRMLTLPADVDPEKVEAKLNNGVLSIVMPKAETARVRKIEVKAG